MIGWYKLPRSGTPFYGEVPAGAEVIDPPEADAPAGPTEDLERPKASASKGAWLDYAVAVSTAVFAEEVRANLSSSTKAEIVAIVDEAEQLIDPGENGPAVGSEVAGVELTSETLEVDPAPPAGVVFGEQLDSDERVVGHED